MALNLKIEKVFVIFLIVLFGINAWIGMNSIWVELPLIVPVLPEQWYLPSYLSVAVQLANIGPLVYGILKWLKPGVPLHLIIIGFIYGVGCISMIFVGLFWDCVNEIFSSPHSVALIILAFCLSLTNCSSSVVALPYMARFKPNFITAYFVGMGLSGMLPSMLALIQGAGSVDCIYSQDNNTNSTSVSAVDVPPSFDASTFFYTIFGVMIVSCLSFITLANWKKVKIHYASEADLKNLQQESSKMSLWKLGTLFTMNIIICGLTDAVLDSIQSFTSMPYGIMAYHLTVVFTEVANPVGCFIAFFVRIRKFFWFLLIPFIGILLCVNLFVLASLSPYPPLKSSAGGAAIMIVCWVISTLCFSYTRTSLANYLQKQGGEKYLFWLGVYTQVGSFIGAMIMFPLVNVYYVFKSAPSC